MDFLSSYKNLPFFNDYSIKKIDDFKNKYYISKYINSNSISTNKIQELIDEISDMGGGLLVIDKDITTGALYFKDNVSLYIEKNITLNASKNIRDYPLEYTRIEGESGLYFPALLNFIGVNDIYIFGCGTINGNGHDMWASFWDRLKWNTDARNKDEERPRLLYISNSNNITINGLTLINSPFWNIHLYKSNNIRLMNLNIYSPESPVKAPSTDGIDVDYCENILIKNNTFDVNDDAISIKGGKGPYADKDFHNGISKNILIIDNVFKFCHSCLTLGSEAIHIKDVILKGAITYNSNNVLWAKMRPDTPQIYENIFIMDVKGYSRALIYIKPWTQYFDLKGRLDKPINIVKNIIIKNIDLECDNFFKVTKSKQYKLEDFILENLNIKCLVSGLNLSKISNIKTNNLNVIEAYKDLDKKYIEAKELINKNIKTFKNVDEKVITISNEYAGIWLEHVYDSIIYGDIFNDYSIAFNTFRQFFKYQDELGQLPCFIKEDGTIGYSQIQECVSFTRLGFILYEKTSDISFLKDLYNVAIKYVDFLYKYRMTRNLGLVEAFVGYDTGHDNSARLDSFKYKTYYSIDGKRVNANIKPDITPTICVDMNSNLYMTLKTIKEIAIILNDSNNINKYDRLARDIKKNLFKLCFDERECFFFDYTNKKEKYFSSTIFHLFLEKVLDKEKDKELIDKIYNKYIKNPKEFYTNYPLPSMSISDKSRDLKKMDNSWGYYSEALIALRCSLWMDDYGYYKDYDHILYKWLESFIKYYDTNPFPQELDPITGFPSNASNYYSSSILLFLYAINRLKLLE